MPPAGRKRTRSQADGGNVDRRQHARNREASADDDDDDDGVGSGPDEVPPRSQGHHKERPFRLPDGYNDRNRAFLQALMAHGALTFQQAQPLLAAILNVGRAAGQADADDDNDDDNNDNDGDANRPLTADDITLDDLREFVQMAQRVLQPLDLDVRSGLDQARAAAGDGARARVWALVSTDHDPRAHLAVLFTPRKLAFVHRLLVALFDTYNTPRIEALCLTEQQALKLSRPPRPPRGGRARDVLEDAAAAAANRDKGLKHSAVLALLQTLVRNGWLDKSAAGFYTPSTRTLLELEPFLVEAFNTKPAPAGGGDGGGPDAWQRIKYCAACREILTTGLRCGGSRPGGGGGGVCTLRLHVHCEDAFWRTQAAAAASGTRTCPRCQTPWWRGAGDDDGNDDAQLAPRRYVGERAITATDVFRRKKRQGRPSEGVDDLMRSLLPRTVPAAGGLSGRPRQSDAAEAAAGLSSTQQDDDENNDDHEGEEDGKDDDENE